MGFGALDAVALIDAGTHASKLAYFFSYFTIESNVVACLVLLIGGLADPDRRSWAAIRGATTLYIAITGIVYAALLAHQDVGRLPAFENDVLHRIIPAVLVLDWLGFAPWPAVSRRAALGWLLAPACFLGYSLIRGPIVHWYPYPFIDPRRSGGYPRVALTAIVLGIGMGLLALALRWVGEHRAARADHGARPRAG